MGNTLRKERLVRAEPEFVWEALTNPAALAEWLMPNNFRAEVGARFEFVTDPTPVCGSGITRCQVLELDSPRRMVWSWERDAGPRGTPTPPMTITWTLTPEREGTRLTLEQVGLETQGWVIGLLMSIGWSMMLSKVLPRVIGRMHRTDRGVRFEPGAIPLRKRYYRCKTVPAAMLYGVPEA